MRLYELYKLNRIKEHQHNAQDNTLSDYTQGDKSTVTILSPYDYALYGAKYRKSVVTETDKKKLLPLIVNNTITLTNKDIKSTYQQSLMSVLNITKIQSFLSKLPCCKSLSEIKDLQNTVTEIQLETLTSQQLIEVLDSLIIQMHKLNVEKFHIPLRVMSLSKDINKVWYDDIDDNYNFLGEVLQKFSKYRKDSVYDNISRFKSKKDYGNFTIYIRKELDCLYSMIKAFS